MEPMERWQILNGSGACVGLVDMTRGIAPDAHELLVPLPSVGLDPGDIIVHRVGLQRIVGCSHVSFDTKEKLYALREAFGGRKLIMDAFPRLTAEVPDPIPTASVQHGMQKYASYEYRSGGTRLAAWLYNARSWGRITSRYTAAMKVAKPIAAADDAAAIDALLNIVTATTEG